MTNKCLLCMYVVYLPLDQSVSVWLLSVRIPLVATMYLSK